MSHLLNVYIFYHLSFVVVCIKAKSLFIILGCSKCLLTCLLCNLEQVRVRQAGLQLLQDALEGSGGGGPTPAYVEAVRIIFKVGVSDKSSVVRTAAAGCLRAVAMTGGPGVGSGGLEACINLCLKVLVDLWEYYITV